MEKSEAELSAAAAKRRENGIRLQNMQAKQRAEKVRRWPGSSDVSGITLTSSQLATKMVELEEYKSILAERSTLKRADFLASVVENTPFETEAELESWVKKTESDIKRKQKKDMGGDDEPEEDPTFPLVDIPDADLGEDEIREKRKQRLMKAGWEARVKAREEKRKEKERQEEVKRREDDFRETDPVGWAAKLRNEQEVSGLRSEGVVQDTDSCSVSYTAYKRTSKEESTAWRSEVCRCSKSDEDDSHPRFGGDSEQQEAQEGRRQG